MIGKPTIGHVHLKVSDLTRSETFYRDVLGFIPTMRYSDRISFLALDSEYHHHLALNTTQTEGRHLPRRRPQASFILRSCIPRETG